MNRSLSLSPFITFLVQVEKFTIIYRSVHLFWHKHANPRSDLQYCLGARLPSNSTDFLHRSHQMVLLRLCFRFSPLPSRKSFYCHSHRYLPSIIVHHFDCLRIVVIVTLFTNHITPIILCTCRLFLHSLITQLLSIYSKVTPAYHLDATVSCNFIYEQL